MRWDVRSKVIQMHPVERQSRCRDNRRVFQAGDSANNHVTYDFRNRKSAHVLLFDLKSRFFQVLRNQQRCIDHFSVPFVEVWHLSQFLQLFHSISKPIPVWHP